MTVFEQLDTDGGAILMTARSGYASIGFRTSRVQYEAVRRAGERHQCSMAAIVRQAVAEWLETHP